MGPGNEENGESLSIPVNLSGSRRVVGSELFCVVPKLLFAPHDGRGPLFYIQVQLSPQAQGTCVGSEQSLGTLLADWIIYLSEGNGTCAHLLDPFGSLLQRAQILGTGSQGTDCEGGLSPAHSCQCRQTSKQAVQGLLSGFLWGQGLVGAHCT